MLDRLLAGFTLLTCLPTQCCCEDFRSYQQEKQTLAKEELEDAVFYPKYAEDSSSGEEYVLLEDSSQLKDFGITRPGGESIMISLS